MPDNYTLATPANMEIAQGYHGPSVIAISLYTDEEYSANPRDYFTMKKNSPLLDYQGNPMILVVRQTKLIDALTGEWV